MSVGFPATLKLQEFGSHVWSAFSPAARSEGFSVGVYQVGSSIGIDPASKRAWHDVDVVCILDDKLWETMGFRKDPDECMHRDAKWIALCLAFSELGRAMTGLPIDFKLQPQTWANEKHNGPRSALGMVPWRFVDP